jgi:hypothetical protein
MFKDATTNNIIPAKQYSIHDINYIYYQSNDFFLRAWYSEGRRLNLALNARAK